MGMLSDSTSVPDDYHAIMHDEASLLADAASHMFVPPFISGVCDGYFTEDEYRRVASLVLAMLHQAHPGMSKMKSLARCSVWWPGKDREIEACVKACDM